MMPSAQFPDLKGASVLITGGGSGIGAALTEGFVRQGCKVAFIDIADAPSRELVNRLEKSTGSRPLFIRADLRDIEALRAAAAKASHVHGPVTVLINNAAFDERHEITDVTVEYWDDNQAINLRPQFFMAQAVAPGMKKAGKGSIINFTSTSFMMNHPDMPSYTAAKAGVIGLTKGLAGKLGPDGIRVNAIAPGWVITERQQKLWVTPESLKQHVAKQCIREIMQPMDIIGPCLFLASDAARMVTAQTLIVDGGFF
jgi:galactose dehydrogenase